MKARGFLALLLLLALGLGLLPQPAAAQAQAPRPGPASPARVADPADQAVFWDGLIPAQLEKEHIAGAVVAVVVDGKVVFTKGYGYADLAQKTPVSPAETLFRPGSISKLFVAVAAMQLAEQGRLDLHADINRYLKTFQIPATFPQPVSMASLLTHTSGLDVTLSSTFAPNLAGLKPLGDYLAANLPKRVYPPGQVAAYSNYGFALAGYVVEQVAGMPFNQYVAEKILAPLGMAHSSFAQPLPAGLSQGLSTGYLFNGKTLVPLPFELVRPWPAGSLSASAADMARFMLAVLNGGETNGARILSAQSVQELEALHFQADPRVSGMAYGFEELHLNNLRLLSKGGDTQVFHSYLYLIPEKNTGFFIAYNSSPALRSKDLALQPFLDRYFPDQGVKMPVSGAVLAAKKDSARYAGTYAITEHSEATYQKIILLPNIETVRATPDGQLEAFDQDFRPQRFAEVAPGEYRQVNGQEVLVFRDGGPGGAPLLLEGNLPYVEFYRVPGYLAPAVQLGLLGGCMLLFLTALLAWPITALVRRRRGQPLPGRTRLARWLAGGASGFGVLFTISFGYLLLMAGNLGAGISREGLLVAALTCGLISAALSLGALSGLVVVWGKESGLRFGGRLYYSLVTLAALAFGWFLWTWNLLGYRM